MTVEYTLIGSLIGFLAVLIAWRQFSRDRSNLKIDVEFHLESGRGTAFLVSLVNNGRRPVSVRSVGLRLHSGRVLLRPDFITPEVLRETESRQVWFPLYEYRNDIHSPLDVAHAVASDTSEREYTVSCRKLRRQINKEWTKETDWLGESSAETRDARPEPR